MDNLEATIKAAAETVLDGTGSYIYSRKAEASLDHDKPSPQIIFFDPAGRVSERTGAYNCIFGFAGHDPDTETREHRHQLTKDMVSLATKFFDELDKHDLILISDRAEEKIVKEFAGRLSGIAYQCTITTALPLNCEPVTA